jgi:hypothetical protein
MIFKDAWVFFIAVILPFYVYFFKKRGVHSRMLFSSHSLVGASVSNIKLLFLRNIIYIRAIAILFFILALARPRVPLEEARIATEGIDIVLAIDSSGSMLSILAKHTGASSRYIRTISFVCAISSPVGGRFFLSMAFIYHTLLRTERME